MDEVSEILQRLTRVETKLDAQLNAKDIAQEALQLAKTAHEKLEKIESGQTWLWRTIGASFIGLVMAALVTAIKLGGK